jgi:hypothetical protein
VRHSLTKKAYTLSPHLPHQPRFNDEYENGVWPGQLASSTRDPVAEELQEVEARSLNLMDNNWCASSSVEVDRRERSWQATHNKGIAEVRVSGTKRALAYVGCSVVRLGHPCYWGNFIDIDSYETKKIQSKVPEWTISPSAMR